MPFAPLWGLPMVAQAAVLHIEQRHEFRPGAGRAAGRRAGPAEAFYGGIFGHTGRKIGEPFKVDAVRADHSFFWTINESAHALDADDCQLVDRGDGDAITLSALKF